MSLSTWNPTVDSKSSLTPPDSPPATNAARPMPARMALDPAVEAIAAVPPSAELALPLALEMTLEVEVIAESLYRCRCLMTGESAPVSFNQLPAPVRVAYRDAAAIALQRIVPHAHLAAVVAAEAVVPGFGRALATYLAALQYAPTGLGAAR